MDKRLRQEEIHLLNIRSVGSLRNKKRRTRHILLSYHYLTMEITTKNTVPCTVLSY